jgi:sec-independent protein translocase protein TatC
MATAIRTIGHEDRLSLVEHLEELRTRLIVSGVVLAVAFGVCMWQNHALLHLINRPLEREKQGQVEKGQGPVGQTAVAQQAAIKVARDMASIVRILSGPDSRLPASIRAQLKAELVSLRAATAKIPPVPQSEKLTTLGIGEPFTTTLTVVFFFALIASLPVILFELYGFVMPALQPSERHAVAPLLTAVPFLFVAGVLFGYFVVLPAALRFFVNFNSSEFNILVQASPYYQFAATVLLAMGFVFQVPVAILGATRAGIVTPNQLRKGRRYAIVACATVAAFLPGDAITLILETVPLYVLYEASILVATFVARRWPIDRSARGGARAAGSPRQDPPSAPGGNAGDGGPVDPGGGGGSGEGGLLVSGTTGSQASSASTENNDTDPSVNAIIDHMDRKLSD